MAGWSETDLMIRDAVRQFVDKEVRPHVAALEDGSMEPYPIIRKLLSSFGMDVMAKENLEKAFAREEAGETVERGPQSMSSVLLSAELAGVCMGLITIIGVSSGLTVSTIQSRGTLAQKRRWLPDLVTFDKVGAWAITEPDSGSDAFGGMRSYVTRDGDGGYLLNGQKTFITNGPDADTIVVFAKLDEGNAAVGPRDRKVLTFLLDRGMPGFTQGKPFQKMGIHTSRTGELFFDNVHLTADRLLGETEDYEGRDSARTGFIAERVGIAAMAFGVIQECLRLSLDYAKSRVLWGQEIARFQLIQLKLAKMEIARMNVENMLLQTLDAMRDDNPPTLAQASAMKLYASEAATEVAMEAVQLFGGNGYMTEYRVEQLARDAKSLMIYAGSNEIQVTHIAKGLLS
ncbi:MAG: acyl-CoA dehydrogenase domain protein [Frankiales bacterium]|nr:acyl-CoA dehydrogenase domain protein [Frankiales bacterium]